MPVRARPAVGGVVAADDLGDPGPPRGARVAHQSVHDREVCGQPGPAGCVGDVQPFQDSPPGARRMGGYIIVSLSDGSRFRNSQSVRRSVLAVKVCL